MHGQNHIKFITVSFSFHLKIHIFLKKRHWIEQKLLSGLKHYPRFPIVSSLVKKIYWPCVPQHTWDTPRAYPSWSQWEWGILLSTGWGTPHSHRDIWCYVIKLSGRMYRTKRKCWIPTTLTRFDASWISLVDVREGCSVSYKANNTEALREDMEGSWAAIPVYTHSSAEFRSAWILAVNIANVCPNSTCVKEPSVYNKHGLPLNNLRGILYMLNCLYIFSRVIKYSPNI